MASGSDWLSIHEDLQLLRATETSVFGRCAPLSWHRLIYGLPANEMEKVSFRRINICSHKAEPNCLNFGGESADLILRLCLCCGRLKNLGKSEAVLTTEIQSRSYVTRMKVFDLRLSLRFLGSTASPRSKPLSPSGGIGRRSGFKILCPYGRTGSSPVSGTRKNKGLRRIRREPSFFAQTNQWEISGSVAFALDFRRQSCLAEFHTLNEIPNEVSHGLAAN